LLGAPAGFEPGFSLAQTSLRGCEIIRERRSDGPQACQGIANGLAVACFALATALGIPRGNIVDAIPDDEEDAA